jgi:DNA-binding LacI/PurR family transcriptional regulator
MSLVEIAKEAGVSQATVSRVLNDRDCVSADTARRVRKAAASIGYRKTAGGPGRKTKEQATPAKDTALNAYALVVPDVRSGLYMALQEGFEEGANEHYQQVLVCNSQNDSYKQGDQILQLMQKRVSAVAVVTATSSPTPPHQVQMLQRIGIPVVLLHRPVIEVRAPLIELPLEEIGYEAGRALLERGHRKVAMLTGLNNDSARLHFQGFQRALLGVDLQAWPLLQTPELSLASITPDVQAEVRASLERMWKLLPNQRPTALFATFDSVAELVYMTLMNMGVRVPQEVSLISFGGTTRVRALTSRLSAIVVDEAQAGRRAAALSSQMRSGAMPIENDHREVMPVELVEGETLGAPQRVTPTASF